MVFISEQRQESRRGGQAASQPPSAPPALPCSARSVGAPMQPQRAEPLQENPNSSLKSGKKFTSAGMEFFALGTLFGCGDLGPLRHFPGAALAHPTAAHSSCHGHAHPAVCQLLPARGHSLAYLGSPNLLLAELLQRRDQHLAGVLNLGANRHSSALLLHGKAPTAPRHPQLPLSLSANL